MKNWVASVLFLSQIAANSALTVEKLTAHFKNIKHIDAQIEQTKKSELLTRPMKSKVKLLVDNEVVTWQTLSPVASKMVWNKAGLKVVDASGQGHAVPPNPGLGKTLGIVRSLVTADLAGLQSEFDLRTEGQNLIATPKRRAESTIQEIKIEFGSNLQLRRVEVELNKESLELEFKSFVAK